MIAPRTVTRYTTPADLRDDALYDARCRYEELGVLLQVPASHVTAERTHELSQATVRFVAAIKRLSETQERVDECPTCPDYTNATRAAAQAAIEGRAMRGMVNDIGAAGYEWAWEQS